VLLPKERTENVFFLRRGTVDVFFIREPLPEETNISADQEECFVRLNKGSYFNLSNALLKKCSLFEFRVSSPNAEIFILSAPDIVLHSKKNEELTKVLKTHAYLCEVDGIKYDFSRFMRISVKDKEEKREKAREKIREFLMQTKKEQF